MGISRSWRFFPSKICHLEPSINLPWGHLSCHKICWVDLYICFDNPIYFTSDLLARGFTVVLWTCGRWARPRNCLNLTWPLNNTKINSWRRSDIAVGRKVSMSEVLLRDVEYSDVTLPHYPILSIMFNIKRYMTHNIIYDF